MAGALVVFVLGVWDDRTPRSAGVRLLLQIGAYTILFFAGLRVETALPAAVDFSFGLACFVVVINGVNFYDGMDGLLPLTAILAFGAWGIAAFALGLEGLLFILASVALLGFLPHNWEPARVFLGDAGSMLIGYLFFLAIQRTSMTDIGLTLGLWVAAVPVCDAGAATIHRLMQRRSVFSGDRDHVYDILFRLGWRPGQIAIALGAVAGACSAGGLAFRSGLDAWLAVIGLYLILTASVLLMRLKHYETGRPA
jgi:UDP-GlcNAc:undecaprenyl-phosphate GlcNAc-1-phosphate transferase